VGKVTTIRKTETHDSVLWVNEGGEGGKAELYLSPNEAVNSPIAQKV